MKAVYFEKTGSIDNLQFGSVPPPSALTSGFRIRFLAGSLNHLDLWVLKGLPRVKYEFPHVAGADLCGEVIELIGNPAIQIKVGDRVLVYPAEGSGKDYDGNPGPENLSPDFKIRGENMRGVFSEEVVVPERYVFPCPAHLTNEEAGALPLAYLTAWQMLAEKAALTNSSHLRESPILLHGAGSGVTQALLEMLLSHGFTRIALTSREAAKLQHWKSRGVHTFVQSDDIETRLKDWLQKKKFAVIFDHVGEALFEMNIRLLSNGGKFVTCGATSGPNGRLDLRHLYFRQLQILGSTMGSLEHFKQMLRWVESSRFHPPVGSVFPMEQVKEAYRLMDEGKQNGKIVLVK